MSKTETRNHKKQSKQTSRKEQMKKQITHEIKLDNNLRNIQFSNTGNYLLVTTQKEWNNTAPDDIDHLYDTKHFKIIQTQDYGKSYRFGRKVFDENDKSIYGSLKKYNNKNYVFKWN